MSAERPTGAELLDELRRGAAAAGLSLARYVAPLSDYPDQYILQLGRAQRPLPLTVERVRAHVAGLPIPERRKSPFADHFGGTVRVSSPEPRDGIAQRQHKQALGSHAHAERRPGETLGECIRRIGREVEEEEQAGRAAAAELKQQRELAELSSPSSLIRRAQRDWPQQSASVAAIAAELGVSKGEAWSRVIAAGIDSFMGGNDGLVEAR